MLFTRQVVNIGGFQANTKSILMQTSQAFKDCENTLSVTFSYNNALCSLALSLKADIRSDFIH